MIRLDVPVHMGVNQQQVFLVGSGGFQFRDFGIKPFSVVEAALDGTEEVTVIGEDRRTRIKYSYYDKLRYVEIGNAGQDGKYTAYKPEVDYMVNLYKEFPDEILTYYPEGCFVYPMFVDIETTSINPKSGEVLSIQVAFDDTKRDEEIFLVQGKGLSEKQMILEFIDLCKQSPSGLVPDICVTYNGIRFDIPYLHSRAGTHEVVMKWNTIGRKQDIIYTQGWLVNKRDGEMSEVANGFRVYDMYTLAKMDLKLAKLPSRTQKNVAAFYGCPDVYDLPKEDKYRMREVLEERPAEFKRYSISDIHQLRYLYEVYAMRTAAEANLLKVPFMTAYAMSSGQKSYIALYREARKAGYYGFKMNQDRYEKYFALGKYQGAIVGSWAHGYYDKIIYVDAASMYPSLMESFNLSPDMYKIVEHIPYDQWTDGDPGIIRAEGPPEKKTIYIPDDNFQTIFKFEVNLIDSGYMRKVIEYFKQVRNDYKAKMKSLKKEEGEDAKNLALQYDAMQMAAKVINNTYYGINGNRYYEIGDLPQAVFVTAMGRWCMTELIKFFGGTEEYPTDSGSFGDTVLEVDTDGLLLDNSKPLPSIDEVNSYIRNRLKDVFSIPEECLTFLMEFEGAGSIYVYKQKNYILRADEDKGKLTVKGSAFTGYDKAPIVKKAVEIMAKSVMFNEIPYDEAVMMCRNLDRPLEDFRYTKTLKKDPDKYSSFESLSNYIMNIEARYGTQKALSEMKSKANKWIEMRTRENKDLKRTAKGLIHDCLNIEELFIILDLVEEMVTGSSKKRSSFYILDIALMYKQRGHSLREDDIIEYYWTATREGYSIADDVKSIAQLDLKRYMKEINRVIERFDYANPSSSELTLY